MMNGKAPGVSGAVTAISGNSITITSKMGAGESKGNATTYAVDATNAKVMKNGTSSSASSIAVGDTIMVVGTVNGTSVTATAINDGAPKGGLGDAKTPAQSPIQGNGEPVVGGTVTAINGSTLTVTNKSNVTYSVDTSAATIIKGNTTSSIASVATGDNVIIQGTVNGTSVTATSIIDQNGMPGNDTGAPQNGPAGFGGVFNAIGGFFHKLFGFF